MGFPWSVLGVISRVSGYLFFSVLLLNPLLCFLPWISALAALYHASLQWTHGRHMLCLSARCIQMPIWIMYKRHLTFWNDAVALFGILDCIPERIFLLSTWVWWLLLPYLAPLLLCTHWSFGMCALCLCVLVRLSRMTGPGSLLSVIWELSVQYNTVN